VGRWPAITIGSGAADRDRRPRHAPGRACRRVACVAKQLGRGTQIPDERGHERICLRIPRAPRGSACTMRLTPPAMVRTGISKSTHGRGCSRALAAPPPRDGGLPAKRARSRPQRAAGSWDSLALLIRRSRRRAASGRAARARSRRCWRSCPR
jgi:hypothetical protein